MFLTTLKKKSKNFILILDNVSYHKSKYIKEFVKKQEGIQLKYLPTYAPEYNPVELVWKFAKAAIRKGEIPYKNLQELLSKLQEYTEQHLENNPKTGVGIWKLLFENSYAV